MTDSCSGRHPDAHATPLGLQHFARALLEVLREYLQFASEVERNVER